MIPTLRECINNYDLKMLETFMANGPFSNMSRSGPFILLIPLLTKYFYTFYTHKKKTDLRIQPEPLIVCLCPCRSVSAGCESEDRAGGLLLGSQRPDGESRHPETGEAPKNLPWRMNAFTRTEQIRGIDEEICIS